MFKYVDFEPDEIPSAVIDGKLVPLGLEAFRALAINAQMLALGSESINRQIREHEAAQRKSKT